MSPWVRRARLALDGLWRGLISLGLSYSMTAVDASDLRRPAAPGPDEPAPPRPPAVHLTAGEATAWAEIAGRLSGDSG